MQYEAFCRPILAHFVFEINPPVRKSVHLHHLAEATCNMAIASETTALTLLPTQPSSTTIIQGQIVVAAGLAESFCLFLLPAMLSSSLIYFSH